MSRLYRETKLRVVIAVGVAVAACACLAGCALAWPLPTLRVHALLTLRQRATDTKHTGSHDFGVQAELAFRPRRRARTDPRLPAPRAAIALPRQPDCQHALTCEWAQLAEEATLSALGVSP